MGVIIKLFFALILLYTTFLFVTYNKTSEATHDFSGGSKQQPIQSITPIKKTRIRKILVQKSPSQQIPLKNTVVPKPVELPESESIVALKKYLAPQRKFSKAPKVSTTQNATQSFEGLSNIFHLLGAYSERDTMSPSIGLKRYHYGLINDDNYCDIADKYNLLNHSNIFEAKNFFTEFPDDSLPRTQVMSKIGQISMEQISWNMTNKQSRTYHFKPEINTFYISNSIFHQFHKIGQHFACATQMYNHIPGTRSLVGKSDVINSFKSYAAKYEGKPQCFDSTKLFPQAFRLYDKEECENFFTMINSPEYQEKLIDEPIQYLLKIGYGSHKSEGVFLMDENLTTFTKSHYKNGAMCGVENRSLIAQGYINNPLLLDRNNKFDFRVYMLIASTNPLIIYSHDGFIKVSINSYEKSSNDRATHLTNTYLANQKIDEAESKGELIHGMTREEIQEYILWSFDRLQAYLLDSGKISDPNWLDNYLRPAFHKAYIHLVRMSGASFSKQSNLYELHGLDFMLDDEMNLWFIESNSGPQLFGSSQEKIYYDVLMGLFDINYAYYRSRMKRVLNVISSIQKDLETSQIVDYKKYRQEYQEAVKNRLEPEYQISPNNTWTLIMDENLSGSQAYMGYIPEECL